MSPELCKPNSTFMKYFAPCVACLRANNVSPDSLGGPGRVIQYCAIEDPITGFAGLTTSTTLLTFTFTYTNPASNVESLATVTTAAVVVVTRSDWTGSVQSTSTGTSTTSSSSSSLEGERELDIVVSRVPFFGVAADIPIISTS
jgi:hypothetical protein